ncbi:hypothetical protein Leryth_014080 [Lithospermum erythrorhizon]|nr:hypothetical protein Leryth_014080 [Lithospermum erythrorhizon]
MQINHNACLPPALCYYSITIQCTQNICTVWVKLEVESSAVVIRARLITENSTTTCVGNVIARHGCWSFLKGGFLSNLPSNSSRLYFQRNEGNETKIAIDGASLQQFTQEQWAINQDVNINKRRKRAVTLHVSDQYGDSLRGASIKVEQISKDFLFGSAIADTIIGNSPYQKWFTKRFNAAVFENELKWYATEPKPRQLNYTKADKMLQFVQSNQISTRGHNIFWEDPKYTPPWVRNLTDPELKLAVKSRIQSLLQRYKDDFIHWDVNNEMLHFNFYEEKLGSNASLEFFMVAHEIDPLATLFMNEFNVVETCNDVNSSVDGYILRMKELRKSGVWMDGVGLEGHFTVPNLPLMRATIDKLATLDIPIWLTEVDIRNTLSMQAQALYLEQVLREGFSHPAVNGIMLWSAMHVEGCYQMCLTDNEFRNLPTGDVVDKLLEEWQTGLVEGLTNERGSYSFYGFLGEYRITTRYGGRSINSTFSLSPSDETRHVNIQI